MRAHRCIVGHALQPEGSHAGKCGKSKQRRQRRSDEQWLNCHPASTWDHQSTRTWHAQAYHHAAVIMCCLAAHPSSGRPFDGRRPTRPSDSSSPTPCLHGQHVNLQQTRLRASGHGTCSHHACLSNGAAQTWTPSMFAAGFRCRSCDAAAVTAPAINAATAAAAFTRIAAKVNMSTEGWCGCAGSRVLKRGKGFHLLFTC